MKRKKEIIRGHWGASRHGQKWTGIGSQRISRIPSRGIFSSFFVIWSSISPLQYLFPTLIFFFCTDLKLTSCVWLFLFFFLCPTSHLGFPISFNTNKCLKYACFLLSPLFTITWGRHDYLPPRLQKSCQKWIFCLNFFSPYS